MKAIILAAGLGTRLKPWTDTNPKALAPIDGTPVMEIVIRNLIRSGIDKICINIHHFGEKILEFLDSKDFAADIVISDEREALLDTGRGVAEAYRKLGGEGEVVVHNADILSNASMEELFRINKERGDDVTLLVSDRQSGRKLIFDDNFNLQGWHDIAKDLYRPKKTEGKELAFSGIYVINEKAIKEIETLYGAGLLTPFPIMDYFLNENRRCAIRGTVDKNLKLLDIGKPASLMQASDFLRLINYES